MIIMQKYILKLYISCIVLFLINAHRAIYLIQKNHSYVIVLILRDDSNILME